MAAIDYHYYHLLHHINKDGYEYEDPHRKGVKRKEVLHYWFQHNFEDGFPILTTKKISFKQIVTELLWFLKGDSSIKFLLHNNCNIWNKDAYNYYLKTSIKDEPVYSYEEFIKATKENPYFRITLGNIYPIQWRGTGKKVDQIARLITNMKEKPMATDHIVNSWVADDLEDMALPPCHYSFQVIMKPIDVDKYGFYLQWNQRSVDTFLGLPYNITSYALLAKILEKITGHKALGIIGNLNKVHIYDNQYKAVEEQLSRDYSKYEAPSLIYKDEFHYITSSNASVDQIFNEMNIDWFKLENYESYPAIRGVEMLERDV